MPKAQEKSRSKTDGKDANTIAAARTMMNGTFWINRQPHWLEAGTHCYFLQRNQKQVHDGGCR